MLTLAICLSGWSQAPTANFTAAQTGGCAPIVINFQDLSTGNPTAWQWNFGNGSVSTLKNPSTTYFTPGSYTVTLTATNAAGSNTITRTGFITIYDKPTVNFIANDSAGCAPFTVRFTDQSTPSAGTTNTTWQWDFGNGTGATAQNPQTTFSSPGNYTVSLKVTNDKGCFASFSKPAYIKLTGGVQIDFSSTLPNRCRSPFPVTFTNNSTGPGTLTYLWDFGDGTTSTQQTPSHTYTTTGAYNVSLAVTSSNGCTDTLRKTAGVNIQNIATSFTAPDSVCALSPANFNNTSSPTAQSSNWIFADGTTSTAVSPSKAFSTAGNYTVQLIQTYTYCTDSFSKSIKVLPKPVAAFTSSSAISCKPPLTVNFTNQSTGAVSWQWDFGDGNKSTLQNPSHTYNSYGNFVVTLIATSSSGCTDTLPKKDFVQIQKPVISFPAQSGCLPYTTTFNASINTLDNVTSYLWDFGDGSPTSTQATPTHTYLAQGNYTVTLTITTSTGCTETYTLNNAVVVGRVPVIDFTSSPNPVCAYSPIQFTGISNEPASTWQWDFGDGGTSTLQNPDHIYTAIGNFNVTMTVTNNGCVLPLPKPAYVQVNPPIAEFTFQKDCDNRKQMMFIDKSIGATAWQWDFGDGTTSTVKDPTHVFPSFGDYTVTLTATNGGCSHSKTYGVKVFDETPSFTADLRTACKTATINYTASSTDLSNIVAYNWNFSNGATSTLPNPQITYGTAGNFSTTLITTDRYGCYDTAFQNNYIRINGPTAAFTIPNNQGCVGLNATFTNQSTSDGTNPIVSWLWNFGDGQSRLLNTPTSLQHLYPNVGSYTPKLIVTDALGCKDSLSLPNGVNVSKPTASFVSADTLNCLGSTVNFSNTSAAQGYTSLWNFGDGTTSTQQNPSHVYTAVGTYNISLSITDQYGCSATFSQNPYIEIKETKAAFAVSDSIGGCTPFEVKFTNASQFYTASAWSLGNGSSSAQNPAQVYNTAGTYNVQLVVTGRGGCTDTATKTINVFDAAATTFSYSPFSGCNPLPLTAVINSPADMKYTWDFGDGSIVNTMNDTTLHIYDVFGDYVPKVLLSDSGNCLIPLIGKDTVSIIGANAKFGWDRRAFCDSGTVAFLDSTTFNDPIVSYTWNFGDGNTSSLTTPVHSFASPGLYTVSLVVETQAACKDTFQVNQLVKVVESPSVRIVGDSVICQNDFVNYTGFFNRVDTSLVKWSWQFPNGGSSSFQTPAAQQFTTAGNFTVQVVATNTSGCTDTTTQNLLVNPIPVITIPSPQITPLGTPIQLPATYTNNIISYSWAPATGLTCTDCAQPFASPKFNTAYTVTAVDDKGCRNKGQVQVIVLCQNSNVFVPNTFSPNNDGSNDVFYVRGKGLSRVKSLRIFNRWGEIVFDKANFAVNDPTVGWDGTYKGKKLSPDVYIYQVDVFCDNSESIRFEGSITLIL